LLKPVNSKVAQDVQFIAKQTKAVAVSNTHSLRELEKTTEPQASHLPISQDIDEKWVLQQKPGKYTLQLMALSKRQSLEKLVKQHLSLQTNLKILQLAPDNRNQERYVLLYGSFLDTKTAYAAVKWLPAEFRQAWPRQFKALQHEIKTRTDSLLKSNQLP
jgi:septal ring-binding cell division protein DamX